MNLYALPGWRLLDCAERTNSRAGWAGGFAWGGWSQHV